MNKQDRSEAVDFVLHTARENDVRFIRLWFPDILGELKGFAITVAELENALLQGIGFDGSAIEGFARIDESDMVALPDPSTFRSLPWRPRQQAVASMFCDVVTPENKAFEGDPRQVLKRVLAKANKMGYTFYAGPECEFFYFESAENPKVLDHGGYFDQAPPDLGTELRRETVLTLEEMGIPVEYSHHEVSSSQHEIVLKYTDALTMADNVMTHRLVVKEIALKHGVYATFMPKPISGLNGSGMHTNMSLFEGDRNVFFDPRDPLQLSSVAKGFIAGLMKHAREITAVTNQWVNSYKRLVPGYEAPVYISWARRNRSDLIRVPVNRPGKEISTRIEYRAPDPACNPYLALSVMLAAGLKGIEEGYDVPLPVEENVYEMSEPERAARGIDTLPGNLWEAVQLAQDSELVRECLGEHVFRSFIQNKKIEWDTYRSQVTDYEVKRYLAIL